MVSSEVERVMRLVVPEIRDEECAAVARILRSGMLVQGAAVAEFEHCVARYLGCPEAVAVSSGTAALHLALLAAGIGPGDEVILPDFTFPATANVVELIGATPVLVDIDLHTFNIDPAAARAAISGRTKALMPVHLFGLSADMTPLEMLAREYGLALVEDAACALGSRHNGRLCGTIGDSGCFSFHPRKVITTGEGGMIVTSDRALAQRLRLLRAHGMTSRDGRTAFVAAGLNYRLTEMQGAIGVEQMNRLPGILARRQELAASYTRALGDVDGLQPPVVPENCVHTWQSYVVLVDESRNRDRLLARLRHERIEATIGTHSVSMQPHVGGRVTEVPRSQRAFRQSISLPLYPSMTEADLALVVQVMTDALGSDG